MRPLAAVAWAHLLVVLDVRAEGVDVVPDPVGWLMMVLALGALRRVHGGFALGSTAALVALLGSLPDWVGQGHPLVEMLLVVVQTVLVFATCTAIMATVPARRRGANLVRWWDVGVTAAVLGLGLAVAGATEWTLGAQAPPAEMVPAAALPAVLVPLVVLGAIGAFAVLVCFLVVLVRAAQEPAPYRVD